VTTAWDASRNQYYETVDISRAIIAGRRTYDDSVECWGAKGRSGAAPVPVLVVTQDEPTGKTGRWSVCLGHRRIGGLHKKRKQRPE
jgi:hypothetical protein